MALQPGPLDEVRGRIAVTVQRIKLIAPLPKLLDDLGITQQPRKAPEGWLGREGVSRLGASEQALQRACDALAPSSPQSPSACAPWGEVVPASSIRPGDLRRVRLLGVLYPQARQLLLAYPVALQVAMLPLDEIDPHLRAVQRSAADVVGSQPSVNGSLGIIKRDGFHDYAPSVHGGSVRP